jgi:hypothetical protein
MTQKLEKAKKIADLFTQLAVIARVANLNQPTKGLAINKQKNEIKIMPIIDNFPHKRWAFLCSLEQLGGDFNFALDRLLQYCQTAKLVDF